MTRGQERLLLALVIVLAVVELTVPILWVDASHTVAMVTAVGGGVCFVVGAVVLSASIAKRRGVSTWAVLLLRDRPERDA